MSWITVEGWLPRGFVEVCELLITWPHAIADSGDEVSDGRNNYVRNVASPGRSRIHRVEIEAAPLRIESSRRAVLPARWRSDRGPFGVGSGRALLELDASIRRAAPTSVVISVERTRRSIPPWGVTTRAFNSLAYEAGRQITRTIERSLLDRRAFSDDRWLHRLQIESEGMMR
jgi:hypothetical protein